MTTNWQDLLKLTGSKEFIIERVRLPQTDLAIEGEFSPPPLACLDLEDQVFVTAFVRCHGSIKQMEKYLGVSYPTIKNRLNRISSQLEFVEITAVARPTDVLDRLQKGEITVDQAVAELKKGSKDE